MPWVGSTVFSRLESVVNQQQNWAASTNVWPSETITAGWWRKLDLTWNTLRTVTTAFVTTVNVNVTAKAAAEDDIVDCKKDKNITDNVTVLNKTLARANAHAYSWPASLPTSHACFTPYWCMRLPSVTTSPTPCLVKTTQLRTPYRLDPLKCPSMASHSAVSACIWAGSTSYSLRHPSKNLLNVKKRKSVLC